MDKKRLLKLADLLEADAANPTGVKFDLGVWARASELPTVWDEDNPNLYKDGQIIPITCGTTACAVGLAAISGAFKDEGLDYQINNGQLVPCFKSEAGFEAVSIFFDIDLKMVYKLFTEDEYNIDARKGSEGELAVAARIREVVASN